ncbi:MAG: DEAD/DEAH box helicase [Acidimicrobiales bacterium]
MVAPPRRSVRLRRWQKRALDALATSSGPDFLAVATPGAGKTTFALTAATRALAEGVGRSLVVVAPTSHLKVQWAAAAARFGLVLEPSWSSASARLPAGCHGVIVTYQQVAANPGAVRAITAGTVVVLDELHHAGDERAWGAAVRHAFEPAALRLALSGTPFRSDTRAIPFVRYRLDEATPDFEYGYGDALADGGVVRPVYFPQVGGFMEWVAPDGAEQSASFDDPLDRVRAAQRLRTALSLDGEWLPTVLGQANARLLEIRRHQPDAAGLVIASDQDHARGIADLLDVRFRARSIIATSEDPTASARIARFAASDLPWIVAVRMVSEGVDIPRLRVGVYATTTTTELFFRQAVGRFVRWTGGGDPMGEEAHLYIPDDTRLCTWAHAIAEQRRHNLRTRTEDEEQGHERPDDPAALDPQREPLDPDAQQSLFAALSATAAEGPHPVASVFAGAGPSTGDDDEPDLVVDYAPPPLPGADPTAGGRLELGELIERKAALRKENAELAKELARFTTMTHREVNGTLNRRAGIAKITEATLTQLERRALLARRWIRDL